MRYAVIVIDLERLPTVSTAVNVKSNALSFDQEVRYLLSQAATALITQRESTSLRLGVGGQGDRVGTVDVGGMGPHALLDRVAEALHPNDTIKRDLLREREGPGRLPRIGEDWTNARCVNPRTTKGLCIFCATEIRPGQGFYATLKGLRAHYVCAPGLGTSVRT